MLGLRSVPKVRNGQAIPRCCNRSTLAPRPFHSHEYERPTPKSTTESVVLEAALSHVPQHGFTVEALKLGSQDVGYLPITTNLFPRAAFDLVHHHIVTQRLALCESFERPEISPASNEPPSDILERIQSLILKRLLANGPYIAHYQAALALLASPANLPYSLRELAQLADEILYLSGSTTVTTAWYTDRAALASIYAATELFMTQDKSRDYRDTQGFLYRRLREGDQVRKTGSMMGQWLGMQLGGLVDGLRSKGIWI